LNLDIPTVMTALLVGFMLLALQLWVAQRSLQRLPELLIWSRGCWVMLTGFAMLPARYVIPEWISIVGANCMLQIGAALFDAAIYRHLLDRPLPAWIRYACIASCLVVPTLLGQPLPTRISVYSLLFCSLQLPGIVLLLRDGWRQGGSIRMVTLTMCGGAAVLAIRGFDAALRPEAYQDLLQVGPTQGLAYLMAFMCLMGGGFGFVLACFERVARHMEEMATTDGLTGCANRSTADALLVHSLELGRREGAPVAFALLDLDHFKQINDLHGHAAGDLALKAFAAAVKSRLRASDVLGRMGGEEFGLVLPMTDGPGALRLVEQVRAAVEALQLYTSEGQPFALTVSAGVVVAASDSGLSASRVYMLADRELYRAKDLGRNRVQLATAPTQLPPYQLAAVAGAAAEAGEPQA
jgi:diguanylate cyclase (GGDEF)-like protein